MTDAFTTASEAALHDRDRGFTATTSNAEQCAARTGASDVLVQAGRIVLDRALLRHLRQSRLLSQQDLADECWRRNIRVSIATIKRAESGHAVRFRIARELARCFDVPVMQILSTSAAATH